MAYIPTSNTSRAADRDAQRELDAFLQSAFDLTPLDNPLVLPIEDEPFVATWRPWAKEAAKPGGDVLEVLRPHLPQLSFPIAQDISQSEAYRQATRQGIDPATLSVEGSLDLDASSKLRLIIHDSFAGGIPVFETQGRRQFETLVRALCKRNEPVAIAPTQGAQMVSGYVNWSRVHTIRQRWLDTPEDQRLLPTWGHVMATLKNDKPSYQDRFMVLSDGPYSAVPATELGLDEATWRAKSLHIRRDHECTHYFTRRLFGSMRNHPMDELMADYAGIVAAEGNFRADWFLRFLGIEPSGEIHGEGRLHIYRGDPPLSDSAFRSLGPILVHAAQNVEKFDSKRRCLEEPMVDRAVCLAALATLRLDELARPESVESLLRIQEDVAAKCSATSD